MEDLTIRPDMSNDEVDERVLKAVQEGCDEFASICTRVGVKSTDPKGDFRAVDRSLQRLRRAEKVYFNKKEREWHTAE